MDLMAAISSIACRLADVVEPWAFTGGVGQWLQGMPVSPDDIDIQTTESGAYVIEEALRLNTLEPVRWLESQRIRSHFGRGQFENWTVEIMGDVQKKLPGDEWTDPPVIESLVCDVEMSCGEFPAMALRHDPAAYDLLGRPEKAERIRSYLASETATNVMRKVTAFVMTKDGRVALFRHPAAGTQVPAGTVEVGESLEDAVIREAREETGLSPLRLVAKLGEALRRLPADRRMISRATAVYSRPDDSSFDWVRMRRGIPVATLRSSDGFTQIEYTETASEIEPDLTYQIIGWVPERALTDMVSRHFYLLEYEGHAGDTWSVQTDNHELEVFWASPIETGELVEPQRWWLRYLNRHKRAK